MRIKAHTMEYRGDEVTSTIKLRNYMSDDYKSYKVIYEEAFYEMRKALELEPFNCCDTAEELLQNSTNIFIYENVAEMIVSS